MAIHRKKDLKTWPEAELKSKLEAAEKEIFDERASTQSTGKPKSVGRYRELRKIKARILTVLKQRALRK